MHGKIDEDFNCSNVILPPIVLKPICSAASLIANNDTPCLLIPHSSRM